jgi:hypothetical protein
VTNTWSAELSNLLDGILVHPASQVQLIALLLIAIISFAAIMRLSANAVGMKLNSHMHVATVCFVALVTSLALVLLIRVYVAPKLASPALVIGLQYGIALLSLMLVAVPIQSWLMKGNYFEALLNMGVSIVGAMLITALCNAGWNAVSKGKSEMERAHQRKAAVENDLSQ